MKMGCLLVKMDCWLVKWGIGGFLSLEYPIKALGGPLNILCIHFVSFCSCFSRFEFAAFKTVKMGCLLVKMDCGLEKLVVQCLCM